ncbi:hypothetical protein AA103196_0072 [Ameyamaea chiangmaiensis NBRC 103196]|uniref:Uncharacterized protein n=1 Tax=Ameyamaea chiangmaiensis TaxID=442969 RepID=A0A850P9V9_9PROT|nr:hypothetical protein [Ameyamaea chiangmaiensis]MBS4075971.1 hypothetical protein [Ameyamaea chiangmaiensis]NVN39743.1 hypothetical protein [Ameyamaea chiangmaiensis]GBQ61575.1 hypothetical protein AA103196_0072 [Ameyamaea chiangmaiensis NBRC 103196]
MRILKTMTAGAFACAVSLASMLHAQAQDAASLTAFDGVWSIDNIHSNWSDGKFPTGRMSLKIDVKFDNGHLVYHSKNDTMKNKPPMEVSFDAALDDKPYPVTGSSRYNFVRIRPIGHNEFVVLELKDQDVMVGALWTLSPDGKTLMRWGIGKSEKGVSKAYQEFFTRAS